MCTVIFILYSVSYFSDAHIKSLPIIKLNDFIKINLILLIHLSLKKKCPKSTYLYPYGIQTYNIDITRLVIISDKTVLNVGSPYI